MSDFDFTQDTEDKVKTDTEKYRPQSREPNDTLYSLVVDNPIRQISKLVSITEAAMQERLSVWDRYRRKYRRGMYYLRNLSNGVPLYFTNYLFATVESVKANLTRNIPSLNVSPRGLRDDLAADLMTRILVDSFERGGLKAAVREVTHHGLIATLSYFKVYFSPITSSMEVAALPPEALLVDPKATAIENARWVIHRRNNVPSDEIYATYGSIPSKKAPKEADTLSDLSREGLFITSGELQEALDVAPVFDVYEAWIRCWENDRENDWYVVTIAGDTVLSETFSPYRHNKTPFVEWIAVEDYAGDNIYHRGVGYIEEIEPLQDRVDALDLKLYKNTSLLSNRQRYVAASAGININAMDNTAGRIYKVNGDPSRAVFYDAPPQMSRSVYEYRDRTEMLMQTVSGVFDVTMGRRPTGITAGRAIESLKDAAETRLASVADTLSESIAKVGSLALQIILQFYDGERLIKSTDGDKDVDFVIVADYPPELQPQPSFQTDMFGFPILDPTTQTPLLVEDDNNLQITPEIEEMRRQWKEQAGIALVLSDVSYDWDIKASTDSALPSARAERGQIAADLFRLGAIDREALLEAMAFPSRHKILQRLAAEATGKNAGDPMVDTTGGQINQIMEMLAQAGLPPEMIDQIMQQTQQGQGASQGGNFPPQMAMP